MASQLEQITATFTANAAEAAEAFARVGGGSIELKEISGAVDTASLQADLLAQPGVVLLAVGEAENGVFLLPATNPLVPAWYESPDTTQNSLLQTLALEIGSLLLPEEMEAFDCKAIAVPDLAAALERAQPIADAGWATLEASRDGAEGQFVLVWSVEHPDRLPAPAEDAGDAASETATASEDNASEDNASEDKSPEAAAEQEETSAEQAQAAEAAATGDEAEQNADPATAPDAETWLTFEALQEVFGTNREEAAEALTRGFGKTIELTAINSVELPSQRRADELAQPGLLLLAAAETGNAVFVFSGQGACVPSWYRRPDTTQNSVLQTLALELGSLLLPEELEAFDFKAIAVRDVARAFDRAGLPSAAQWASLTCQADEKPDMVLVAWCCAEPERLAELEESEEADEPAASVDDDADSRIELQPFEIDQLVKDPATATASKAAEIEALLASAQQGKDESAAEDETASAPEDPANSGQGHSAESDERPGEENHAAGELEEYRKKLPTDFDAAVHFLPIFTKSLLRIRVPVSVKLASTKKPVGQLLDLALGQILQFDKSCDEPLTLEIGGRQVAFGDVVKVGEKFGLRISAVCLPPERFAKIRRGDDEHGGAKTSDEPSGPG